MARILIVEDQPASRDLLVMLLGYHGHVVLAARDGEEGLALALAEHPDLVITDILMPTMDGYEFARRVRADPALAHTRVMFYTATYLVEEVRKLAEDCGVAHVLTKPAEPEEILEVVSMALDTEPPALASAPTAETDREYLRLLTDTLHRKVEELRAEVQIREQTEARVQRQADRARVQAEVSRALAEVTHDYQAALDTAARQLASVIGDGCVIAVIGDDGTGIDLGAAYHTDPEVMALLHDMLAQLRTHAGASSLIDAIQARQPMLLPVTASEQMKSFVEPQRWSYLERIGIYSLMQAPLRAQDRVVGLVTLVRSQQGRPYTEDDLAFLQDLADRAALAIVNARLYARLQESHAELEQRVRERTAELQQRTTMIDLASDAIFIRDYATDTITYWNRGAERLYGWPANEVIGQHIDQFLKTEFPTSFDDVRAAFLYEGHWEGELVHACRDGRHVTVFSRWTLEADASSRPASFLEINTDVTERKRAEEELRRAHAELEQRVAERTAELARSEREFRSLADNALVGIFRATFNGEIRYVNEAVVQILGFPSAAELMRQNSIARYKHPEERALLMDVLQRDGKVMNYETELLTSTGDTRIVLLSMTLEEDILSGMLIDITERKQAEAKIHEQAARLKVLAEASRAFAEASLDYRELLELVACKTAEALGDNCTIRLLSDDGEWLNLAAIYDVDPEMHEFARAALAASPLRVSGPPQLTQQVLQKGQPLLIPVVDREQLRASVKPEQWPVLERLGIHSLIVAPMHIQGRTIGVLSIARHRHERASFDEHDLILAQDLADRAALAITNARLFEQVQEELTERARIEEVIRLMNAELERRVVERTTELARVNDELTRSNADLQAEIVERTLLEEQIQQNAARAWARAELSQALAETGLEYQPLFETIAQRISELMEDACTVTLLTEDGQWLQVLAIGHPEPEGVAFMRALSPGVPYRIGDGIAGRVAQTGEALLVPVVPPEQIRAQMKPEYQPYLDRFEIASLLIVPLRARGRILGTLGVSRTRLGRPYTFDDQAFLQDLADRAGLAIESTRLFMQVREAREAADRANLAKSEFLSSMSHELRTPLNAIIGFTGTLLMKLPGPLNADQEKQLTTIQSSARHLLSLINDLLDLAKIESGKVELTLEPVVCQEVIDEVAAGLRPLAERKGLRFTQIAPSEPIVLRTDRRAFSQIVINLANNAIKFTDQGAVRIELAREQAQRLVKISVMDTGIGIKAEDQARLFREFGRVDSASVRREGTGLGLHLSRRLAHLLGGQIEVQSNYGVGSTFTLVLPEQ